MDGLWMKLIICPLLILFIDAISGDVYYSSWFPAVVVGLILAVAGHLLELMFLRRGTLWTSTILDFLGASAIVFLSQFLIYNTYVTVVGAMLTASFFAIAEYFMHGWLIRSGRTRKAAVD
jgi:hypothetical protein